MSYGCCAMRQCADWLEGRTSDNTRRGSRPPTDQRRPITNSLQLIQSANYEFGLLTGGVAHHQLSTSADRRHRAAWARLNAFWPSAFIDRLPEGLDRARRNHHFALIVDSPTAEYVTTRHPCDLYASDPFLDAVAYGFVVGRRVDDADQLRAGIDQELVRLRRDSVLQRLYLRWWRSECNEIASVEQSPASRRRSNRTSTALDRGRPIDVSPSRHRSGGGGERKSTALNTFIAVVSACFISYCTVL